MTVPSCAWLRQSVILQGPGIHRLEARTLDTRALRTRSNPIEVLAQPPAEPLFWGDLHAQSVIGCGARSIDAYFAHARDFSASDFASHQANCFLVSRGEWRETQASTQRHHTPRRCARCSASSGRRVVGRRGPKLYSDEAAALHRCARVVADKSDADTDLKHVEILEHYRAATRSSPCTWAADGGSGVAQPDRDRLLEFTRDETRKVPVRRAASRSRMGVTRARRLDRKGQGNSHRGNSPFATCGEG